MKSQKKCTKVTPEERAKDISCCLRALGIPSNISGFDYLRCAVTMMIEDPSYKYSVTKGLYIDIAKKFKTTSSRVERVIRYAIETGWVRANDKLVEEIFGYSISAQRGKPTNSEFIATVADYIEVCGFGKDR